MSGRTRPYVYLPELVPCSSSTPFRVLRILFEAWVAHPSRFFEGWVPPDLVIWPLSRFGRLSTHLFHKPAHGSDVTWGAAFDPGFITLCGFFQVSQVVLISKPLPALRDSGLGELPDSKKLA